MTDARALADRIKKASSISLMEQPVMPGPIWAMPLSDAEKELIVAALVPSPPVNVGREDAAARKPVAWRHQMPFDPQHWVLTEEPMWDSSEPLYSLPAVPSDRVLREALEKIARLYVEAPGFANPVPSSDLVWKMYSIARAALTSALPVSGETTPANGMREALEGAQRIIERDFPNGQLAIDIRGALRSVSAEQRPNPIIKDLIAVLKEWVGQGYIDADGDHCGSAAYAPQVYARSVAALEKAESAFSPPESTKGDA